MTTTRRNVLAAGGAGIAALGLAACGRDENSSGGGDQGAVEAATSGEVTGTITFQTWSLANERFTPYFEDLVAAFEEQNEGVTVEWVDQPGDGYQDQVLNQANTDSLPDVINLPPNFAYPLTQNEFLLDLAAADPELKDVYVTGGVEAYEFPEIEGSYGYPWYLGTDMNYWNLAELEQYGIDESSLPTTVEDLFELARSVKEQGGDIPVVSNMPEVVVTSEGGEFNFNNAENVEIVQQYADLYADGAMPPEVLNNDYAGNTTLYKQGGVLWTTASSSFASDLNTEAPGLLDGTVATQRLGTPPLFVQGICVAANSANVATALAFAKFVTNDENQTEFVRIAQGFLPGTQAAAADPSAFAEESDLPLQNATVEIAAESMETAEDTTNVQWTDDMATYLTQQLGEALQGNITPQEALDAAVEYGNDNLG